MVQMYLEIGKYCIRDWREGDAASIAPHANNRKIWLNLRDAFPHPYTVRDAEKFISQVTNKDPVTVFAIATTEEPIGSIGLMPGVDVHRYTAELGYWLAEPYWGRGIATLAVKALTVFALKELRFKRIFAEPYATNPASARVLEKAGFTREGLLRANVFKDGEVLDQFLYSYVSRDRGAGSGERASRPVSGD